MPNAPYPHMTIDRARELSTKLLYLYEYLLALILHPRACPSTRSMLKDQGPIRIPDPHVYYKWAS